MTEALHDASEALRSQPGFGPEPPPPRAGGMSVDSLSPCGPVTTNFNPSSSTAVADVFREQAFCGCSAKTLDSFSIASRIDVAIGPSSGGLRPAVLTLPQRTIASGSQAERRFERSGEVRLVGESSVACHLDQWPLPKHPLPREFETAHE